MKAVIIRILGKNHLNNSKPKKSYGEELHLQKQAPTVNPMQENQVIEIRTYLLSLTRMVLAIASWRAWVKYEKDPRYQYNRIGFKMDLKHMS